MSLTPASRRRAAFTVVFGTLLFLPGNWIPLYASAPVLLFLFGYSYTKRFTLLSHFWLGAALMLAPAAAWVAIRGEVFVAPPWVLGGAVLLWVAGFDMIYFDRSQAKTTIEKDLVLCEACGAVISTADHIRWVSDRLGPLAYSNPTLFLSALSDAKVLDEVPARDKDLETGRQDVVRMLCSKCRREVQLKA